MTEEKYHGNSSLLGCEYTSEATDQDDSYPGGIFHRELLLHFCLQMLQFNYDDFSVAIAVRDLPLFNDIVIECDRGRSIFYVHVVEDGATSGPCVTREHLNGNIRKHDASEDANLWQKFNLHQYFDAVWGEKFSEMRGDANVGSHFVLLTNLTLDGNINRTQCNQYEIFSELSKEGAQVVMFDNPFNISPITAKFSPAQVVRFDPGYFRNSFLFVSNSPSLVDLSIINYELVQKIMDSYRPRAFMKILREKFDSYISLQTVRSRTFRKRLFREDMLRILSESLVKADLEMVNDSFRKEMSSWVKFHPKSLNELDENMKDKRVLVFDEKKKLSLLKLNESLKLKKLDVLLIPSSKLNNSHLKALSFYGKEVILFIDDDTFESLINKYPNHIFVVGKRIDVKILDEKMVFQVPECCFADLTTETKEIFLKRNIKLQEYSIKLSDIQNSENRIYLNLLNGIFEKMNRNENIKFGMKIPNDKIPKPYISRQFTMIYDKFTFNSHYTEKFWKKGKLNEAEIGKNFPNCIIRGDVGVGKTIVMISILKRIKNTTPRVWTEYIDLGCHLEIFSEKQKSIDSQEFSGTEAETILIDHLVSFHSDQKMDRDLFELYLTYEEPVIYLFFDNLNKIPWMYEKVTVNLIQKLSELNVKIFLTCRSLSKEVLSPLRNFLEVELTPYTCTQSKRFLQQYWCTNLNLSNEETEEFTIKFLENFSSGTKMMGNPHYLKLLADIYTPDCEVYMKKKHFPKPNIWSVMSEIVKMSFNEDEWKNLMNTYTSIAIKELNYDHMLTVCEELDENILTKGFVQRNDDGKITFDDKSLATFFAANALLDEMESGNKNVVKYLSEFSYNNTKASFIYENLIGRFIADKFKLPCRESNDFFDNIMEFFKQFLKFSWIYAIDNISSIYSFVECYFTKQEIQSFNIEKYWEYSISDCKTMSRAQLTFLIDTFDKFNEPEMVNYILAEIFQHLIARKIQDNDIPFLDELHGQMIKRATLSEDEFFVHFKACMKQCAEDKILREDLMFWYFSRRNITQIINIANVLKMKYEENWKLENYDMHFIAHLSVYEKKMKNSEKFLNEFYTLVTEGSFYEFISNYNDVQFSREQFIRISINVVLKKGWSLRNVEGNSILYEFWRNRQTYLFSEFMKSLPYDKIDELTNNPSFNGRSLIEFYHSVDNQFDEFSAYLKYVNDTVGEVELLKFLTPCKTSPKNAEETILKDLIFLKEYSYGNVDNKEILQNIVIHFCYDKMHWQEETKSRLKFLHEIARFVNKSTLGIIFDLIFVYLNTHEPANDSRYDNYLSAELAELDESGNNPFLTAALAENVQFIECLLKFITRRKFIDLTKQQNVSGKNFFHCIVNFTVSTEKHSLYDIVHVFLSERNTTYNKTLTKLLTQQDKSGRTPFHSDVFFFVEFIDFIPEKNLENLFVTQDATGDNIMHYMLRDDNLSFIFQKHLPTAIIPPMRQALKMTNTKGETPFCLLSLNQSCSIKIKFDRFFYGN
ncbi:hypothetical protein DMENIID0001_114980 [Sergentomyia squamirostris]